MDLGQGRRCLQVSENSHKMRKPGLYCLWVEATARSQMAYQLNGKAFKSQLGGDSQVDLGEKSRAAESLGKESSWVFTFLMYINPSGQWLPEKGEAGDKEQENVVHAAVFMSPLLLAVTT